MSPAHTDPMDIKTKSNRPGCIGCFFIAMIVICFAVARYYLLEMREVPLSIGKQTTRLTKPLKANGKSVDYFHEAQKLSEIVVPSQDNIFAAVCEQFGQVVQKQERVIAPDWLWQKRCEAMQIDFTQPVKHVYTPPDDFLSTGQAAKPQLVEYGNIRPERAGNEYYDGRWTTRMLDRLQPWMDANNPALDAIHSAFQKRTYYIPLVQIDENAPLFDSLAPPELFFEEIVSGLHLRAMSLISRGGNDSLEMAWNDVLLVLRMEELLQGNFGVYTAHKALQFLLSCEEADEKLLQKILTDLQNNDYFPDTFKNHQNDWLLNRYETLDALAFYSAKTKLPYESRLLDLPLGSMMKFPMNWNRIAVMVNQEYDRLAPVFAEQNPNKQRLLYQTINMEDNERFRKEQQDGPRLDSPLIFVHLARFFLSVSVRSNAMAKSLMESIRTKAAVIIEYEYCRKERNILFQTAVALELYKKQNAQYPPSLEQLVPDYLLVKPYSVLDPNSEIGYEIDKKGDGFVLHGKLSLYTDLTEGSVFKYDFTVSRNKFANPPNNDNMPGH